MWNFKYAKQSDYLYILFIIFSKKVFHEGSKYRHSSARFGVAGILQNAPFQKTCLCQLTNQKGVNVLGSSDVFVI